MRHRKSTSLFTESLFLYNKIVNRCKVLTPDWDVWLKIYHVKIAYEVDFQRDEIGTPLIFLMGP